MIKINKEKIHGMTVIRNKFFPFPGYKAINLFGILFAKPNAKLDELTINHESIHSKQFKEVTVALAIPLLMLSFFVSWWFLALIPFTFYLWYVVEFMVRWAKTKDWDIAYRGICFEMEAYEYEDVEDYTQMRGRWTWLQYLR